MKNISAQMQGYRDELLKDLAGLVRIDSVRGEPREGMPFGEGPAKALDYCMELGKKMGFAVCNEGNRAGHVEYGEGGEILGILAHCDVVPAGAGWTKNPFECTVEGGRMYGRGVTDDKGPAVAALYCLKALKDSGIKPKRRIRVIIGASEEMGMDDLPYYFAHQPMPDLAFSPDGEYPVCNREKGILHLTLTHAHDGACLFSLDAGEAANVVPVAARAKARISAAALRRAAENFEGAQDGALPRFAVEAEGENASVTARGKSAHGSTPAQGVNAALYLIRLLRACLGDETGELCRFLDEAVGVGTDGAGLGIAVSDAESGALTLNIGVVKIAPEGDKAIVDIRYPVTKSGEAIFEKIRAAAEKFGVRAEKTSDSAPLFVPEESELVQKLLSAYHNATGEEAHTYSSGGGTYARELKNGVAFGACFHPCSQYNIHGADEFAEIDEFMRHCGVCLQAIYELACL